MFLYEFPPRIPPGRGARQRQFVKRSVIVDSSKNFFLSISFSIFSEYARGKSGTFVSLPVEKSVQAGATRPDSL